MKQLKKIIDDNVSPRSLRIFLGLLCEKHKVANTSNKELIVLLFGHIASVFKTDMLDPLDKPPNLVKTVVRMCDEISTYLKENSSMIHRACALSLIQIFENCIVNKEDKMTVSLIFYEPLASIVQGGCDKMAQQAATHCLFIFMAHIVEKDYEALTNYLCPKAIALYLKSRCDHCDFIKILIVLLDYCGIKYFVGCLTDIFAKLVKVAKNPDTQTHLEKVEACTLLELLAFKLQDVADLVVGFYHPDVMKALEVACKDRVLKVQKSA